MSAIDPATECHGGPPVTNVESIRAHRDAREVGLPPMPALYEILGRVVAESVKKVLQRGVSRSVDQK